MNWFKAATNDDRSGDILVSFDSRWLAPFEDNKISVIFRRRIPTSFEPIRLFVYIGSPKKILLGCADIEETRRVELSEAKKLIGQACLSEKELNDYFSGYTEIGIYLIGPFQMLQGTIGLDTLNEKTGFVPPQSFVALSHRASDYLSVRLESRQ